MTVVMKAVVTIVEILCYIADFAVEILAVGSVDQTRI